MVRLAAIGPGTARALAGHGLRADLVPEVYDAAHLGEALAARARGRVLLLRARDGSPALTQALERAKLEYNDVAIYETCCRNPRSQALREAVEEGRVDLVTFTSASTVKGFLATVGAGADLSRITGVCIGEQTAAEARRSGIPVQVARSATLEALTACAVECALSQG